MLRLVFISILCGFIIIMTGCEKSENRSQTNYTDDQGLKQGKWVEYYMPDSTQIKIEVEYKDDNKVGEEKEYYRDGMIRSLMTWEADTLGSYLHGPYYQFHPNGRFMQESYYSHGIPDSSSLVYYADGTLQMRGYYKTGLKVGHWVMYDPSGDPVYTIDYQEFQPEWVDDTKTGVYTYLVNDSLPVYRASWLYDNLVSDTIFDQAGFDSLVSKGVIESTVP